MLSLTTRIFLGLFSVAPFASVAYVSPSYTSLIPTILESEAVVKSTTPLKREGLEQLAQNRQPAPQLKVKKIKVIDSNVLGQAELNPIIQPFEGRSVTLDELQEAADKITQLYLERGFLSSRAVLVEDSLRTGVLEIRVIEGTLEAIEIEGTQRLNPSYIISQVKLGAGFPLNIAKLEDQLRLLRANPLLENIEASLRAGSEVGKSILTMRVIETDPYKDSRRNTRQVSARAEARICIQPARIYVSFLPQTFLSANQLNFPTRADDQLELILVTSEGKPIRRRVAGATRRKVITAAQRFQLLVTDRESPTHLYLTLAQQLYQWLVAPLEEELEEHEIDNLVFVMDIGLRSLPLAALHDGENFIVERYTVGLMPSLNLVDTCYVDIQSMQVLAMGAEEFPDQAPLPTVPTELSNIMKFWPGHVLLNEEFSLFALREFINRKRRLQPFQIIHLSTHGNFQSGELSNSYIQLWDSKLGLDQLGQLGLYDPPVELLVLSSSRTALGDREAELGFAGWAVKAGVKSALASFWYVSDAGTLGLMTSFYEHLREAPTKAEALRRAQLAMLKGKVRLENGQLVTGIGSFPLPPQLAEQGYRDLSHPYYWSGFTLVGSPW